MPFENELFEACTVGNINLIRNMVLNNADINIKSERGGNTPLMYATGNGYRDIVRFLMHCGANPNVYIFVNIFIVS